MFLRSIPASAGNTERVKPNTSFGAHSRARAAPFASCYPLVDNLAQVKGTLHQFVLEHPELAGFNWSPREDSISIPILRHTSDPDLSLAFSGLDGSLKALREASLQAVPQ